MAVILSDDTLPNRTVIVSPISSWIVKDTDGNVVRDEHGNSKYKSLQRYHFGLEASRYSFFAHDSYVKLDQIFTLTREALDGQIVGCLTDEDMFQVDMLLMIVLDMLESLRRIVEHHVEKSRTRLE